MSSRAGLAPESSRRPAIRAWIVLAAILLAAVSAGCGASSSPASDATDTALDDSDALRVVVTFSVLGDLVRRVAGDGVDLRVLVGPGGDPHDFTPSPADQVAVARADLIFAIGLGYEIWLDRLVRASATSAPRVVVSRGIDPLITPSGLPDPHVWHDVGNAILIVENVRDALRVAAPAQASGFDRRAAGFADELAGLDAWMAEELQAIPPEYRRLVVNHDSFRYLARRYGLEMVGAITPALAGEAVTPSARAMADLVDRVRDSGAPAVFAEKGSNPGMAAQLAVEAGIALVDGLYSGSLGPPGSDAATYTGMVRANVSVLVEGLSP